MFNKHDAGKGKRNWDTSDCTVRALCVVSGLEYDRAWRLLYELQGEHKTCSFRLADFLRRNPERLNVKQYIPCKAERGKKRMTADAFCKAYPNGRYLLRQAHHITAVVNGTLIDRWDCSKKCVYSAWRIS